MTIPVFARAGSAPAWSVSDEMARAARKSKRRRGPGTDAGDRLIHQSDVAVAARHRGTELAFNQTGLLCVSVSRWRQKVQRSDADAILTAESRTPLALV